MENGEKKSEENDAEFLQELNSLTNQIKTDEEIQEDFKLKQKSEKEKEQKKEPEIKENNNNINENPFNGAFNMMNSNNLNLFDFDNGDLLFESLNSISSKMNQINTLFKNTLNNNKTNGAEDINKANGMEQGSEILMEQIMEFLIQSDLLKHTISNMKKTIEDSFENNKNNLKSEEINKYEEAISTANNILDEINKVNFDKKKILDSLQKLQQISNDIDGMLGI